MTGQEVSVGIPVGECGVRGVWEEPVKSDASELTGEANTVDACGLMGGETGEGNGADSSQ